MPNYTPKPCAFCGVEFVPTSGRNAYCAEHRGRAGSRARETVQRDCITCGKAFATRRKEAKVCSDECRSAHYKDAGIGFEQTVTRLTAEHPVRQLIRANAIGMSEHRQCWEAGDFSGFLSAIHTRATLTEAGCWEWHQIRDGYPFVPWSGKRVPLHRLALEAKHGGKPLGKQAAHHMCANSRCVNPDHLQPVTARENTAEMLARTYMETRIADLEAALAALDPSHPLLAEIGVARAA